MEFLVGGGPDTSRRRLPTRSPGHHKLRFPPLSGIRFFIAPDAGAGHRLARYYVAAAEEASPLKGTNDRETNHVRRRELRNGQGRPRSR